MGKRGGGGGSGRGGSGETDGAAPVKQRFNKGKFKSFNRGRSYVSSEEDMERRDRFEGWKQKKKNGGDDSDIEEGESGEEESSSEEEEGQEGGNENGGEKLAASFKKKVQVGDLPPADGESSDEEEEQDGGGGGGGRVAGRAPPQETVEGLTRKERDEAAKEKAREDYLRKYREGETEQARKDLARLAEVRARREEAARKKEEELKLRTEQEERQRLGAAALEGGGEGPGGFEKLDPREIKKMNGPKLKECLKERGLSTQGQKKELMDRLVAFAAGK